MDVDAVKELIRAAYAAGFEASGDGWNGEYPFADRNEDFEEDKGWIEKRNARIAPLLNAVANYAA